MKLGYIGSMPKATYAQYFIPPHLKTRWIFGGGMVKHKAPDGMYSPTGRVCLLKHAKTVPTYGPDRPPVCQRPGCTNFVMSKDARRKVCEPCRIS